MPMLQSRFKHHLALTVTATIFLAACAPLNRVPDVAATANASASKPAVPVATAS
ncbi:MAG: hypothetical protein ING65_18470, partial [Rhodocyclaceae bacterium]|nr:hypothetical protein [Rhodocyclaceae bacterium]